jgi:hypothetical protein
VTRTAQGDYGDVIAAGGAAEFVAAIRAGFRDAVGIQQQRVARVQGGGGFGTTPVIEGAEHGGGGVEDFDCTGGAQQQRRAM